MIKPEYIKARALELGFDLVGFTSSEPVGKLHIAKLRDWLARDYAGQMQYMHRNFDKRTSPAQLLPHAKSVICVGLNYRPQGDNRESRAIANYALYQDYHQFIKDRLYLLAAFIKDQISPARFKFKVCVDSVPLAERALAARAGLGFIGKNRMLINPKLGSQILLGELVSTLELPSDLPAKNLCSDCDRCIKACPTNALQPDGTMDASKCISYLTIEHKGEIQPPLADKMGNSIFGCDRCILACPFEKNAPACKNEEFRYSSAIKKVRPADVLTWNEHDFEENFSGSPVERTGLQSMHRNARISLHNQQHE